MNFFVLLFLRTTFEINLIESTTTTSKRLEPRLSLVRVKSLDQSKIGTKEERTTGVAVYADRRRLQRMRKSTEERLI